MRDAPGELAEAFQALGLRLQSPFPLQGLPGIAALGAGAGRSRLPGAGLAGAWPLAVGWAM